MSKGKVYSLLCATVQEMKRSLEKIAHRGYSFLAATQGPEGFTLFFQESGKVDFELCVGTGELKQTLAEISRLDYTFLTATQNGEVYTVFFRRYL